MIANIDHLYSLYLFVHEFLLSVLVLSDLIILSHLRLLYLNIMIITRRLSNFLNSRKTKTLHLTIFIFTGHALQSRSNEKSRVMRKSAFCIAKTTAADQRLRFCYIDITLTLKF